MQSLTSIQYSLLFCRAFVVPWSCLCLGRAFVLLCFCRAFALVVLLLLSCFCLCRAFAFVVPLLLLWFIFLYITSKEKCSKKGHNNCGKPCQEAAAASDSTHRAQKRSSFYDASSSLLQLSEFGLVTSFFQEAF
jgi:hypothetical protein